MYKYLIIGIAFMFTISGNYYIRKAGGAELISKAMSGETKTNSIPLPIGDMVGLYICDTLSGCKNKHILLLKSDQTSELLQISNDVEVTNEEISEINTENTEITKNNFKIENEINLDRASSTEDSELNSNKELQNSSTEQISTTTVINDKMSTYEEIIPSNDDNTEISSQLVSTFGLDKNSIFTIEKGTWDLDIQNILVINIKERGTSTYQVPQKIVVKNIDESGTFSKISYTKSNYENMINPTFVKQQ